MTIWKLMIRHKYAISVIVSAIAISVAIHLPGIWSGIAAGLTVAMWINWWHLWMQEDARARLEVLCQEVMVVNRRMKDLPIGSLWQWNGESWDPVEINNAVFEKLTDDDEILPEEAQ